MRRGFSLLELLLFLSLASIAIAIISAFLITLNRSNQENTTRQTVEEDARFIRKTLTTAIQNAQSVRSPDADGQTNSLTLITQDNDEVTYKRRTDNFYKERANSSNKRLNSDNVLVTQFSANYIDPNASEEGDAAIRFSFTVEYDTPSGAPTAFEYQHTQTVNHTVSLGNRPLSNVPDPDTDSIKFWLRADRGVVTDSNGKVSRWYDQSGNAYTASQPRASDRPAGYLTNTLNGYPVVNMDGGYLAIRDWVYNTANTIDGVTMFAIAKSTYTGSNPTILVSHDRSEYYRFSFKSKDSFSTKQGANWSTSANSVHDLVTQESYVNEGFTLLDAQFFANSNPDKRLAQNGTQKNSGYIHNGQSLGTGTTRYGFVGIGSEASSFNGDNSDTVFDISHSDTLQIAELLVYDTALSESQRTQVRRYLNEKYGVYKSLE